MKADKPNCNSNFQIKFGKRNCCRKIRRVTENC